MVVSWLLRATSNKVDFQIARNHRFLLAFHEAGRLTRRRRVIEQLPRTVGIDFGLVLLAKLLGEDIAKMTQLALEYDPAPPFDAGSPQKTGERITAMVQDWVGPLGDKFAATCQAASKDMSKYAPKK